MNRYLIFALLLVCVCGIRDHEFTSPRDKRSEGYASLFSFPCVFTINVNEAIVRKDGSQPVVGCDYLFAHSGYSFSMNRKCNSSDYPSEAAIVRGDLLYYDSYSYKQYPSVEVTPGSECSCQSSVLDDYNRDLLLGDKFYSYFDEFSFRHVSYDSATMETIDGVDYYVLTEDDSKIYINKDKLISRVAYEDDDYVKLFAFTYNFDVNANKDLFKLDSSMASCCTGIDETFFEAPQELNPCWYIQPPDNENFYDFYQGNFSVEGTMKVDDDDPVAVKIYRSKTVNSVVYAEDVTGSYKRVYRPDLVDGDDEFPIFTGDNNVCTSTLGDEYIGDEIYYKLFGPYELFEDPDRYKFYYKESFSCGNEQCTLYCLNTSKILCLATKDSQPHTPVHFEFSTKFLFHAPNDKYISLDYTNSGRFYETDVFKLDQSTYPGCDDDAYESPELSVPVYFSPASLPCSFVVTVQETFVNNEQQTEQTESTFAMNSLYVGKYYEQTSDGTVLKLIRGDFATTLTRVPQVEVNQNGECHTSYVNPGGVFSEEMNNLFYSFTNEYPGHRKETIGNVEYDVYFNKNYYPTTVYVDENGFIAKTIKVSYEGTRTREYTYFLENANMGIFTLTEGSFQCGEIDERFYQEPVMSPCKLLTVYDPSETMCAFGVDISWKYSSVTTNATIYFSYTDKDDKLPVLAVDYHTGAKTIYRGDLGEFSVLDVPVLPMFSGSDNTCSYQGVVYDRLTEFMNLVFAPFTNELTYISEEAVACGSDECTKYCSDPLNRNCVTMLKSEPHHVLKYESTVMRISYTIPVEADDMTVFTLDKEQYPGCESHRQAYKKPKICSSQSSSDSESSSEPSSSKGSGSNPSSSNPSSSNPSSSKPSPASSGFKSTSSDSNSDSSSSQTSSKSVSSASCIRVAVGAVVLALAAALL